MDALSADMREELDRLRGVFLGFAAFGAPRGAAPPAELDGVGAASLGVASVSKACLWHFGTSPEAAFRSSQNGVGLGW